jgi:hypothetical protein
MPLHCTVPPLKRMAHIGCELSFHPLTSQLTHKPTSHPMPRLAQPSGALWRMRVQYTARCKLALLTMAKRLRDEEGISLRKLMGGLCRLVVKVWLCGLVVGLVVRVVWAGCLCCEPLPYLLSCKAHKHKCTKKLATNSILGIAGKLSMSQTKL